MDRSFLNFLSTLFYTTQGYMPFWPMDEAVEIGDMLLFTHGKMVRIGNIRDLNISNFNRMKISSERRQLKECWSIKDGVNFTLRSQKDYVENEDAIYTRYQKGIEMTFDYAGAFFFQANEVSAKSIDNFHDFSFQMLQFLAAEQFSFREIYLVSSTACVNNLALAIASEKGGQMFISVPDGQKVTPYMSMMINTDLGWDIEHASGVEHLQFIQLDETIFFKAKKLEVSAAGKERALNYIMNNLDENWLKYVANIENYALIDMLPASAIYPASAHEYFHFRDLNQNDLYALLNG